MNSTALGSRQPGHGPDSGLRIPRTLGQDMPDTFRGGGQSQTWPRTNDFSDLETDIGWNQSDSSQRTNNVDNNPSSTVGRSAPQPRDAVKKPKYPQYSVQALRLATYREWPRHLNQKPEQLAEAGFYYSGVADSVRCFYCAVGLRNWDPDDDPWVEHARWSPKCAFLVDQKGQEFVNLVLNAARQQQMEESLQGGGSAAAGSQSDLDKDCAIPPKPEIQSEYQPTSAERKNPLLSDAAQSVLAMGYLPRVVKIAVDHILSTEGWKGMKGEKVAERVFQMEDRGEITPENSMVPHTDYNGSRPKLLETVSDNKEVLEQENSEMKERTLCKICCEQTVCIVFLPCGHLVSCAQCAPALKSCPVCRVGIRGTVRVCFA